MTHTYAFVGLTPSERSLLESIFALDADVDPGEALAPVRLGAGDDVADLLIVNGDDLAVVEQLRAKYPEALLVLVGQPPGGQNVPWPVMRRPLDLHGAVNVLSELDWPEGTRRRAPVARVVPPANLLGDDGDSVPSSQPPSSLPPSSRPPATAYPTEDMSSAFAATTITAPLSASAPPRPEQPLSARMAWAVSEIGGVEGARGSSVGSQGAHVHHPSSPTTAQASAQNTRVIDILVVHGRKDGHNPSLARGLHRMGYAVKVVASADAAMAEMARHRPTCVFMEQHSLGSQWLQLAHALNALRGAPTQPPHLAVVARTGSVFERLRARMAGCLWMQVPIESQRLVVYLKRRGVVPSPLARAPGEDAGDVA